MTSPVLRIRSSVRVDTLKSAANSFREIKRFSVMSGLLVYAYSDLSLHQHVTAETPTPGPPHAEITQI
jgi:hypothetical protein